MSGARGIPVIWCTSHNSPKACFFSISNFLIWEQVQQKYNTSVKLEELGSDQRATLWSSSRKKSLGSYWLPVTSSILYMNWIKLTSASYYIHSMPEGYNLPCKCPLHVGKLLLHTAFGEPSFHRLLPPVNLVLSAAVPLIKFSSASSCWKTSNIPNKHFIWIYLTHFTSTAVQGAVLDIPVI